MPELRKVSASEATKNKVKKAKVDVLRNYSFFPVVNPKNYNCLKKISEWKNKMALLTVGAREAEIEATHHIDCECVDDSSKNIYEITDKASGELQGYVWASDASLDDWCNFHYAQWVDKEGYWHGCLTPQVSSVDGSLNLEAVSGTDTRDFRLDRSLPGVIADEMEKTNKVGRKYNKTDSKFEVKRVERIKKEWQK